MQAVEQCTNRGLTDGFLDSCIFDVLSTGDTKTFLEASSETQIEVVEEDREVEEENEVFIQREFDVDTAKSQTDREAEPCMAT